MRGKCPHCLHDVFFVEARVAPPERAGDYGHSWLSTGEQENVQVDFWLCPNCDHLVVFATVTTPQGDRDTHLVWPRTVLRPVPPEVHEHIKKDYVEAVQVLPLSAKASAALSRRCLQTVLAEAGGAKSK
jgi:hypothetical protein